MLRRLRLLTILVVLAYIPVHAQILFRNVTDSSGLGNFHQEGYGTAMLDFDDDGILDIFVVGQNGLNKMFRNSGDIHFSDVTSQLGIQGSGSGWGVCYGDFDADYDEDIYVSKRDSRQNEFFVYSNGRYIESATALQVDDPGGFGYAACFAPLTKSMALDLVVSNQAWDGRRQSCRFFAGNVGQPFTNLTFTSGIADSSQYWDCVSASDYDNDHDLDLLVSGESYNRLYRNNGRGGLVNISDSAQINIPRDADTTGYGIAWGDYNNDRYIDYYISYWHDQAGEMYRNNGDGTFTDVTSQLGLGLEIWCHSVSFGDFNNDGWLDIYSVSAGAGNKLYCNDHGTSFSEIGEQAGVFDGNYGCGLSVGDLNLDGKLDLVVGHYFGDIDKVSIYKNITESNNNWVKVKVNGFPPNPDAIGARVEIYAGGLVQIREVSGGSGFGSQNMLPLHFGLGTANIIDSLIITYPIIHVPPIKYYSLAPNRSYELPEIIIDIASTDVLNIQPRHDIAIPIQPSFKIVNLGNVDVFRVDYIVELVLYGQRTHIDSTEVQYLAHGDSLILDFSPYYLPQSGEYYTIEGISMLNGDQYKTNDTIATSFYSGYAHDIKCELLSELSPDSIQLPLTPLVSIRNLGINIESDIAVDCEITHFDSVIFSSTINIQNAIPPGTLDYAVFPEFIPNQNGIYLIKCTSHLLGDLNPNNNCDSAFFEIRLGDCHYTLGDINHNGFLTGQDIVYAIRYFRGISPPSFLCECGIMGEMYVAGDVNGSCSFNGVDILNIVNYLKGGASLIPCPYCPPQDDLGAK